MLDIQWIWTSYVYINHSSDIWFFFENLRNINKICKWLCDPPCPWMIGRLENISTLFTSIFTEVGDVKTIHPVAVVVAWRRYSRHTHWEQKFEHPYSRRATTIYHTTGGPVPWYLPPKYSLTQVPNDWSDTQPSSSSTNKSAGASRGRSQWCTSIISTNMAAC